MEPLKRNPKKGQARRDGLESQSVQSGRAGQEEQTVQAEQTERIRQAESCLDRASQAVMQLAAALDEYAGAQDALRLLDDYYGSDAWKDDFAADAAGRLPHDLKRGVLSEDTVWNLLEDVRDLKEWMREIAGG